MHKIFNTLYTTIHAVTSNYERTEQNRVPLSNPSLSHGRLQSAPNYYERREFAIMTTWETLKQKYPQHSSHVSFVFLASYSHGNSSPTVATCIIVNSMAKSSSVFVWQSHVSQVITEWNFSRWCNQWKFLPMKYLYVTFSRSTVELLSHEIIYTYGLVRVIVVNNGDIHFGDAYTF